jgi:DNA-directed RNA polymerase sigma subunit (sigma70/sigma32)
MQQLVSELERPVVLSDRALRQLARLRDARSEHVQRHGREPSFAELADHLELAVDQVERLMATERIPRGLDEPVGGGDEATTTLAELLADPRAEDAYDCVPLHLETSRVRTLIARLNPRERLIVAQRFGLDGAERTLRELAGDLGVSSERVRQIEVAALDKLRTAVSATPARTAAPPRPAAGRWRAPGSRSAP